LRIGDFLTEAFVIDQAAFDAQRRVRDELMTSIISARRA